jgi:hypothetical protein
MTHAPAEVARNINDVVAGQLDQAEGKIERAAKIPIQ